MADQPVPDLPDAPNADVPRVMGVRVDNSLALTPTGLPLTGGTLTGVLALEGASTSKIFNQTTPGSERLQLQAANAWDGGATLRLYGDADTGSSAGRMQFMTGGVERMRITAAGRVTVDGDLQVNGVIIGGGLFAVEEGIATADVADGVTVNEAITALLNEVRTLNARLDALETTS